MQKIQQPVEYIRDKEYKKNFNAIEGLAKCFQNVAESLYSQKGKYAPQFLSKLMTPIILQRGSFSKFIEYGSSTYPEMELQSLVDVARQSRTLGKD